MDTIDFTGRVAIVTGAGGGLGREYALELARRGALVVVNDLGVDTSGGNPTPGASDQVVDEIRAAGGTAVADYNNVATRTGGSALVETATSHFGRLDIVVVNAGLVRTMRFEDQTDAQIDAILDVNLKQGFYVGQPAYRLMKAQGYGRFVFMASAVGMFGEGWQSNYGASKGGLVALSNIIALEGAAHGIRSNAMLPTAFSRMSEQISHLAKEEVPEIGRMAAALDFGRLEHQLKPVFNAALAVYLASEQCQSTHGIFSSLGGRYARVSVGVARGWRADGGRLPTVEDVAENWARIADVNAIGHPQHVFDEFRIVIDNLAGALPVANFNANPPA